ncbi:MAG TPA: dihydropteroate synthase [Burkholderiaceae bacterium]|nr:dihydropteroate synthase [Burkholderiaceae bacterium]
MPIWRCGAHRFTLTRPLIMGVVNVTPDSFSDGGRFFAPGAARERALQMLEEGADLLDVGGESTRPGAQDVAATEELRRVVPLIETLAAAGAVVSVDTSKAQVMRAALAAGASVINDVRALREPGAVDVVAGADCGVVLMHMQGEPRTMQAAPHYDDVAGEVAAFLQERRAVLRSAGVAAERIAFDPGFGFGKTPAHNYTLLARLRELAALGSPLLVGMSRKSMLGHATGRAVDERLAASIAAVVLAVERGAAIVRVHDVAATRDALRVRAAMQAQAI